MTTETVIKRILGNAERDEVFSCRQLTRMAHMRFYKKVNQSTVSRALTRLVQRGEIERIGGLKYAKLGHRAELRQIHAEQRRRRKHGQQLRRQYLVAEQKEKGRRAWKKIFGDEDYPDHLLD